MRYHDITKVDMNNGDGLRVVLWVSGCSHHCKGCQNPITWDENEGVLFDDVAKKEIFDELDKDYISGITLSGGDPLFMGNRQEISSLIEEIKEKYPTKTIWMWTGYKWEEIMNLPYIKDIDVLVDGKFILEQRNVSLKWKGSPNQRVIDVKKTLASETPEIPILHCVDEECTEPYQTFDKEAASCC